VWKAVGVVLQVPPISWLAALVYVVVAKNRHRLPGGTPACKLP
jgi:predicted DCC family thiol-disulfide oxidoreductase YuxK